MQIVEHIPDPLSKYGLIRITDPLGNCLIKTGTSIEINRAGRAIGRNGALMGQEKLLVIACSVLNIDRTEFTRKGYRFDVIRPLVAVRAQLQLDPNRNHTGHYQYLKDRSNPEFNVLMNVIGLRKTLALVLDGSINVVDGWMDSCWTFNINGGYVTTQPAPDWILNHHPQIEQVGFAL